MMLFQKLVNTYQKLFGLVNLIAIHSVILIKDYLKSFVLLKNSDLHVPYLTGASARF